MYPPFPPPTKVEIPWSKLGSRPVKVLLLGVSVLVGPVDRNSWGDQEVRERRLGIKRAALEKAEAATKKEKEGGKGSDDDTVGTRRSHGNAGAVVEVGGGGVGKVAF